MPSRSSQEQLRRSPRDGPNRGGTYVSLACARKNARSTVGNVPTAGLPEAVEERRRSLLICSFNFVVDY